MNNRLQAILSDYIYGFPYASLLDHQQETVNRAIVDIKQVINTDYEAEHSHER